MTFPYREVLRHSTFANWGVLTEDPSDLSRASFGRTIEEKSPGVVVSNGNKRERADCAFHSDETAFAYNQRKGEREEPNRAGTTTYRARVSLGKRDRSAVRHPSPPSTTLLSRALHPSHCNRFYRSRRAVRQTIYLAKMPAKVLCNVHSREYCAITTR